MGTIKRCGTGEYYDKICFYRRMEKVFWTLIVPFVCILGVSYVYNLLDSHNLKVLKVSWRWSNPNYSFYRSGSHRFNRRAGWLLIQSLSPTNKLLQKQGGLLVTLLHNIFNPVCIFSFIFKVKSNIDNIEILETKKTILFFCIFSSKFWYTWDHICMVYWVFLWNTKSKLIFKH